MLVQKPRRSDGLYIQNNRKGIFWREEDAYDLKEFNLLSSIGLFRITAPGSWAIPFA
jgi:hypothetical protein